MQTERRLQELSSLLRRYAHRWGPTPSRRMYGWVDEYNRLKEADPKAFEAYCKARNYCTSHDGYDCLA